MKNCSECDKANVCPKAKHLENYRMRTGCNEFFNHREILYQIFSEIETALDNRHACTHTLTSGSMEPCCVYESELADDIENIKHKYLGGYYG